MSALFPIPILLIGCMVLFIASGWMQQRAVDRWTRSTGRAPMIQKSRGIWAAYMRDAKHEMPASLLRQISVWKWVGISALILSVIVGFSAGSHRR
jgi:hypothetical protein